MAPRAAARQIDDMDAQLRRVTLLFADIQGSTQLVQHLEPEAAANLLGPAIQAMVEEVERFEGVASDRGDGIMAVFGAPSACEDHAVRACLAGLAIRDRLGRDQAPLVKARIGIHYGQVVFRQGRLGKLPQRDVFGVAAHIAARLEQTAEPGMVCLSSDAYRLARGFVHAEPLSSIQVKGIDRPVERMVLLGADQTANRWGVRAERGLAGFADRVEERKILGQALENGTGLRLIQISGPAGIGKSRLLHEFLASDAARRCYVVQLIGDVHRRFAAYHPISTWLRAVLDIRSSDSARDAQRKLGRMLAQLGLSNDEQRQQLETMLDLGERTRSDLIDVDQMKPLHAGEMIAAIADHLSERRPIILVCEDIDVFDPASRELCEALAQAMASVGVLFVATSRTRVRLTNLPASFARSLMLSPLADDDAAQLLVNLNPQFRDRSKLTTSILVKAGGNPLFLEEVASLIVNVRAGDAPATVRLIGENDNFAIPDQVEALIADRLAQLPREQHRLVQACAVIGEDVSLRLASKLTGIREAELYKRLVKLQAAHLLYETRKYPDPQFSFKHALTRDVAYNTIVPSKRRKYHESIVAILESETADAHDRRLDDLCMHSIHAQAWKKAIVYLQLAAGLAVQRSSYELAEGYLNRALEISRTLADDSDNLRAKVDILLSLRSLVGATGKYLEVSAILDEADAVARQVDDPAVQSRVMAHRAHVLNTLGDLGMAVALAERSRETAQALDNKPLFLLSTFFLGQAQFNMGNIAAAEEAFAQNVKLFPHISPPIPTGGLGAITVLTHGTRALTRAFKGDFPAASQDARDAKRHANESGRPYDLSFAAFADGFVDLQRRQADAAIDAFYGSIALAERREPADATMRSPHEPWVAEAGKGAVRAQVGLGHALLLASDFEGAAHWLLQAYAIAGQHSRYMVQIWAGTGLALLYFLKQQDDLAARYAEEASAMGLRYHFYGFRVQALRARGLIRAANPATVQDGIGDLRTALSVAAASGMRTEVAHCHAAFALALTPDMAHHIQEAQRLYGILEMKRWGEQILTSAERGKRSYC